MDQKEFKKKLENYLAELEEMIYNLPKKNQSYYRRILFDQISFIVRDFKENVAKKTKSKDSKKSVSEVDKNLKKMSLKGKDKSEKDPVKKDQSEDSDSDTN